MPHTLQKIILKGIEIMMVYNLFYAET